MAGTSPLKMERTSPRPGTVIQEFKHHLSERLDASHLLSSMWSHLTTEEQEQIYSHNDQDSQCLAFIEILQHKPVDVVEDFLKYMERNHPDLLTNILLNMLSGKLLECCEVVCCIVG